MPKSRVDFNLDLLPKLQSPSNIERTKEEIRVDLKEVANLLDASERGQKELDDLMLKARRIGVKGF